MSKGFFAPSEISSPFCYSCHDRRTTEIGSTGGGGRGRGKDFAGSCSRLLSCAVERGGSGHTEPNSDLRNSSKAAKLASSPVSAGKKRKHSDAQPLAGLKVGKNELSLRFSRCVL